MLRPESEFMQHWDTRQSIGEIDGFLTAFAHLNSSVIGDGCEHRSCHYQFANFPRGADLETSMRDWLRPVYRANQRSIKSLVLEETKTPVESIYNLLWKWLFMNIQPHDGGWRDDLVPPFAARINGFQNWSSVHTLDIPRQPARCRTIDNPVLLIPVLVIIATTAFHREAKNVDIHRVSAQAQL